MEWYPWYPQLYQQKTLSLTLAEDAAYRRLLDAYMTSRQPLPDDDIALARLIGIGINEWREIAPSVREYFKAKSGKLWNQRCDTELLRQDRRTKKHSEISKKGAEARWNKNKDLHASGKPTAMPPVSRTDATGQDKTRERKTRVVNRFEEFWKECPQRTPHSNPKKPAKEKYDRLVADGADENAIIGGVKNYRAAMILEGTEPKYIMQTIKFLNREVWKDYTQTEEPLTDADKERIEKYTGLKVV